MDINSLKALAKQKKEVWHPVGDFEFRVKRLSLMDLHKLEVSATEHTAVGELIHSAVNVTKKIALAYDAVTGWRRVKVKNLVEGHEDGEDDVPFDRELLDVLSDNYPIIRPSIDRILLEGAVSYSAELEKSEKN